MGGCSSGRNAQREILYDKNGRRTLRPRISSGPVVGQAPQALN